MIKLFSSILLGFLRNPKLGSAISNDYVISRMVTCDADNLGDYQSVLTSTHTNCLIQIVKERLVEPFVSTEARILRCPQCLSSVYFEVFRENLVQLQPLGSLRSLVAGGESYSVTTCCQLPFSPLPIRRSKHFQSWENVQLVESQGVFRSVCPGSGAQYKEI